ncbi:unnamed protein product [Oreochromis niloticus]|nr:unnamed protein product [Mustela putorius furo]
MNEEVPHGKSGPEGEARVAQAAQAYAAPRLKTRWNSLYLIMERFCEQFPAIQAAAIDPRIRKSMENERLAKMGNDDLRKAEEFVVLLWKHSTSTLAVSSDKSPTCGDILPILQKLQQHYTVQEDDSA